MSFRKAALLVTLLLALSGMSQAADRLSLRLVEASAAGEGVGAGLEDVGPVLTRNLPRYTRFDLVDSKSFALPASDAAMLKVGYKVSCQGQQESLVLRVERGEKVLMSTTVGLQDGTPLIIGGFPSDKGTYILVLIAR